MEQVPSKLLPILYKQDSKGKIRTFQMEISGGSYRTITGLIDGAKVTSEWTVCKPKNVGRANATSAEQQAVSETLSKYAKKRDAEHYCDNIEDALESQHKYFAPMLAEKAADVKWEMVDGQPTIVDPKLDGMRMVTQQAIRHSRKGKPIIAGERIHKNLTDFFTKYPTVTLDGELYNHEYHADFQALMSVFRKEKPTPAELDEILEIAEYHVYDMFDEANPNMTALERKRWLDEHLKPLLVDKVYVVEWALVHTVADYQAQLDKNLENGYEGSIVRIPYARYLNKRSKSLIKIKIFDDAEYIIVKIVEGKGNRAGMAGAIDVLVNGAVVSCGIRGNKDYYKHLLDNAEDYPGLPATVRFFGFTNDGKLRFPIVVDINRPD